MNTSKPDLYQQVTDRIVASLENGVVPWRQQWGFTVPAQNHFSGHVYRGLNQLLFYLHPQPTPYFGTIRQINAAGGRVKKGSKGQQIFFYDVVFYTPTKKRLTREAWQALPEGARKACRKAFILRVYNVFNLDQVEGVEMKPFAQICNDNPRYEVCEEFVKSCSVLPTIRENASNEAYYAPGMDYIQLPALTQFASSEAYYSTLFHEAIHSTGHASRLNRFTSPDNFKFASETYSKEELVAEIGANYLCNHWQIANRALDENADAYVAHWISKLREDPRFVFEAASQSQAATDFLLSNTL